MTDILVLLVGIVSGVLGNMLGLGGGTFTIPILIVVLNMDMHSAISLSLISVIAKSLISTSINIKEGFVNIALGLVLAPMAIIGSLIGGLVGLQSSTIVLSIIFATALVCAAILVYIERQHKQYQYIPNSIISGQYHDTTSIIRYTPVLLLWGISTSVLGGFLGGIVGVGGGGILVPVMKLINKVPTKAATATSIFIMGFSAIPPTILYYSKRILNPQYAVFIIIGSLIGAILANKLIKIIPEKYISKSFAIVLLLIAIFMIFNIL